MTVMLSIALLLSGVLSLGSSGGREAQAPVAECLGNICLGMPERDALQRFGKGLVEGAFKAGHCYSLPNKSGSLSFWFSDEEEKGERGVVGILVTSIATCPSAPMSEAFGSIATCRAIRLGSSVAEVEEKHLRFQGDGSHHYPWANDTPTSMRQYDSHCRPEKYSTVTSIYLKAASVIGIGIWYPDC